MYTHDTREKLQDIIGGKRITWQEDYCTATRNFLSAGFSTNTTVKTGFDRQLSIKEKQSKALIDFIDKENLWVETPPASEFFLTEGGESEIFFNPNNKYITKLNDAAYYATWLDFLNSILIHNLLFEATFYELQGFIKKDNGLKAVLRQSFIISDARVSLAEVKLFLEYNGFMNTKRNDYYNEELGLILEDIHDENVIMNSDLMFFIDTVFYINLKK